MPIPVQLRAWHAHLAKVRAKHPNMKPTDLAKLASKSYHSKASGGAKKPKKKKKRGGDLPMFSKPVSQKQMDKLLLNAWN
jgi:hypothetical protein